MFCGTGKYYCEKFYSHLREFRHTESGIKVAFRLYLCPKLAEFSSPIWVFGGVVGCSQLLFQSLKQAKSQNLICWGRGGF